jgi:lysophospholipase L1-like esterase
MRSTRWPVIVTFIWATVGLLLAGCAPMSSGPRAAANDVPSWVGTWAASPQPSVRDHTATYDDETVRLIVHTTVGGTTVRVRLSNTFGGVPLHVGAARLARRTRGANVDPRTDRPLTFGGQPSVDIPPRGETISDPVDLDLPAFSDLAVSLHFPMRASATTSHLLALQTSYVAPKGRDATGDAEFPVARTIDGWPFLTGVDVRGAKGAFAVVVLGDSIVDGDGSTPDANARFPDQLAVRLARDGGAVGVLNEGIIGNRLLADSPRGPENPLGEVFGPSAVARFEHDALAQAGVRVVIVRTGTNDLGFPGAFAPASEAVGSAVVEAGYAQLVARAHARGLRVVGATLSPFEGADLHPGYFTAEKEGLRQEINAWIRGSDTFDAVTDADLVLADPEHRARLRPSFDSGDHIHPNDAGYAALADAALASVKRALARRRRFGVMGILEEPRSPY